MSVCVRACACVRVCFVLFVVVVVAFGFGLVGLNWKNTS